MDRVCRGLSAIQRAQFYHWKIQWQVKSQHSNEERDFKSVTNSKTLPFIYHYLYSECGDGDDTHTQI